MADATTIDAAAYTSGGTPRDRVSLPSALFDGTINVPVMHRAVKAYLTNQREGNASTKTRGLVTGGNQKPWRQKGTGRARQGSIRSPLWPGGGTAFGPLPRDYEERLPRKMRLLARKSALNARAAENAIFVIDAFRYDAPRTKALAGLLARLGVAGEKALVLTDGIKPVVYLSGRNLPNVHVMPYAEVTTYHLLWSDVVLIESAALGQALEPVAETEPPAPTRRKERASAAEPATKPKKKAAARTSARKTAAPRAAKAAPRKAAAKSPARKSAPKKKKKGT